MGLPYIDYIKKDREEKEKNRTISHRCVLCKIPYCCDTLTRWHFCLHGYHPVGMDSFVCNECLKNGGINNHR